MKIDRTKNSIKNTAWGFVQRIVTMVGPFIVRTVLIYQLSAEYSGLNSLFTAVLHILSLSELGFSNAIVYSMYKPIAEDDQNTICALLNLYRKAYKVIGLVILGLGTALMPFLHFLIKGNVPADINIYLLYLIFLINTSISYLLFGYKTSLLSANQREDVISRNTVTVKMVLYITQIAVLLAYKNYYIYIILLPISTVAINVLNSKTVDRMYPEITCRGIISNDMKTGIKKRLTGLMIWKIGGATRNTLDSIIVSAYLGLTMVTIYNNYYYIMSAIIAVLGIISTSMAAGVGNKIATESPEVNYRDYCKFNQIYMWISGWCTVCMACLYQPFMHLWMGPDMMLPVLPMFLFCAYFLLLKSGDINSLYYQATGLWWEGRYRSLVEAGLNLTLNLTLGRYLGVTGILLATIISMLSVWFYGSGIIFHHYFTAHKPSEYYLQQLINIIIISVTVAVTYYICTFVSVESTKGGLVITLAFRFLICCASIGLMWLFYRNTKTYPDARDFLISIFQRVKKRNA